MEQTPITHIPAGEGTTLLVITDLVTFKLRNVDTRGAFFLAEVLVQPRGGVPLHRHPAQETFYIIEGEFDFSTMLGDQTSTTHATSGAVLNVPSGIAHGYVNVGTVPGRMLFFLSPAGKSEQFFEEVGTLVQDPSSPPSLPGLPPRERLAAAMRKYQVEMVLPAQRQEE